MLSVVYHGRALPVAWIVVQGQQGHFPQATHCAVLAQIQPLIPTTAEVTFLGDGECAGTEVQALLRQSHWQYGCRSAPNILMTVFGKQRPIGNRAPTRGELLGVRPAWITTAEYGPGSILAIWKSTYDAPIYLVTNMTDLEAALAAYRKRAHMETFFSDQKSRGFTSIGVISVTPRAARAC